MGGLWPHVVPLDFSDGQQLRQLKSGVPSTHCCLQEEGLGGHTSSGALVELTSSL
jgi:hypothetical protein